MHGRSNRKRGFTITEMMVVIAVIILVVGLLIPALGAFRRNGLMTKSMANLRQIAGWMTMYSSDNRDFIVPSQFNYRGNTYPGKVRKVYTPAFVPLGGGAGDRPGQYRGTWTDILWTVFEVGVFPEAAAMPGQSVPDPGQGPGGPGQSPCIAAPCQPCQDYLYDSPDREVYCMLGSGLDNPFRSAATNSRGTLNGSMQDLAKPYGAGAQEPGQPGYFAANNFFNADRESPTFIDNGRGGWYTGSQIRVPSRSMYVVDSFAGEVIEPQEEPFQVFPLDGGGGPVTDPAGQPQGPHEVDFRYTDTCLMLFLDGHSESQTRWEDLEEVEGRGIRVRDLTSR